MKKLFSASDLAPLTFALFLAGSLLIPNATAQTRAAADLAFQLAENPPMQVIKREAPPLPEMTEDFEVREGFTLIESLDEFRAVTKQDNQKIRLKPGHYIAEKLDPPVTFTKLRGGANTQGDTTTQEQVFAVTGSNNHFDMRGVVITIPISLKGKLTRKVHMADNWRIAGANNTIEGAYFRTDVDRNYPDFFAGANLFEVVNDGNTFLDCIFHVKGSSPYGYTDFYGKGGGAFTRLDKHSFMSLEDANNTTLQGCEIYNHAFGHGIHFHKADGVLIEDCFFSGALRPTRDIYREKAGLAHDFKYRMKYRTDRAIPRDQMIPLTEDAVRSYNDTLNVVVRNTTIERQRGCFQLLCDGDITLENVTVREAGDFYYDLSAGRKGKVVMENCFADLAYNPIFNLTRGDVPYEAFFEITILSPEEGVRPTPRTSLGIICGDKSMFIFHEGKTRRIASAANKLTAGGRKPLINSTVLNYTDATITLEKNVKNSTIRSIGKVRDRGENNTVVQLRRGTTADSDKR